MIVLRFCNVVASETYITTCQFFEIAAHQYRCTKDYFRVRRVKAELRKKMDHANSYAEWKVYAMEYDKLKDIQRWKENDESELYDWVYIKHLTEALRENRENDEHMRVIHLLRSNSMRNLGNILDIALFSQSYVGTKHLIEEFQQEIILSFEYIAKLPKCQLSRSKKLEFFAETRHAFGRTAVIFSGGAGIGRYHYGVIKTLYEEGLLPRIVAGSSVGSMFASFLCTRKLEALDSILDPTTLDYKAWEKKPTKRSMLRKIKRLFVEGYLMDINVIRDFMRDNIGDLTFQEAYDRTGWILNITATGSGLHDDYRILNYLTAPNVLIWSAVCCSCALPYIYGEVDLYCKDENNQISLYVSGSKKFLDGTIAADIPVKHLSEMFNVNYFVVSQTNPWIVPFMNQSEQFRYSKRAYLYRAFELMKDMLASELKHRCSQLIMLGLLPKTAGRYLNIITQNYSGNITIFPDATLEDYFNILKNPCVDNLRAGLVYGARRVFPKVNHIAAVLVIEKALEKNYLYVRSSMDKNHFLDEIEERDMDLKISEIRPEFSMSRDEEDMEEGFTIGKKPKRVGSFKIPRTSSIDLFKKLAMSYNNKEQNIKSPTKLLNGL